MHVDVLTEDEFIVFLNNQRIVNIDFTDHDDLEEKFKKIFITLKQKYGMSINGYYNVKLYRNEFYGIILDIKVDDMDYLDYRDFFDNQVEMNIEILDTEILYEIDDFFFLENLKNVDLYSYHNKIYLSLKDKLDDNDFFKLIEFSKLVYGLKASKILKNGKKYAINN